MNNCWPQVIKVFLDGTTDKESACQCRRHKRSLRWEGTPEKEMATHSSILGWKIPWTKEPGWATVHGVSELDMTECVHTHTHTHTLSGHQTMVY